jgi:hypothetical protein
MMCHIVPLLWVLVPFFIVVNLYWKLLLIKWEKEI